MLQHFTTGPQAHQGSGGALRRIALIALLTVAASGCGGTQDVPVRGGNAGPGSSASIASDPDGRTAIVLPVQGRHLVLTEMRGMLTSVQGYVDAAARGDTAGMRAAAQASGMAAARDLDPAMQQRLPAEFLRLGMSTHAAWDSLAVDVSRGVPTGKTLTRLGAIMGNCVACHAQFRINVER
ncbi:MAG: hypothetical protein IT355_13340 [Gemmatimonadaceae bacterium]|nr:hypothetical protein [Gemmatimonadaceae bacterium]